MTEIKKEYEEKIKDLLPHDSDCKSWGFHGMKGFECDQTVCKHFECDCNHCERFTEFMALLDSYAEKRMNDAINKHGAIEPCSCGEEIRTNFKKNKVRG